MDSPYWSAGSGDQGANLPATPGDAGGNPAPTPAPTTSGDATPTSGGAPVYVDASQQTGFGDSTFTALAPDNWAGSDTGTAPGNGQTPLYLGGQGSGLGGDALLGANGTGGYLGGGAGSFGGSSPTVGSYPSGGSFGGGSAGGAYGPVVLDLTGGGIKITPKTASNVFYDMAGDGRKHRTAWAGVGNGVLVLDNNGGQITQQNQVVFTDWDPAAKNDMQALAAVFDTNHDGKLDSGDTDWSLFKIMVTNPDGTTTLETLAQAGISSINLLPNTTNVSLPDGSAIQGETSYAKTGGGTGTAADVSLAFDASGYAIENTKTVNGSTTTIDNKALNPNGTIANETIAASTVTTSGSTTTINKTTTYDLNGDGVVDQTQTESLTVVSGVITNDTLADYTVKDGVGVLMDETKTTTSGVTTTIWRDTNGAQTLSGSTYVPVFNQEEIETTGANSDDTIIDLNPDGSTKDKTVKTQSSNGLVNTTSLYMDANASPYQVTTDTITKNADGSQNEVVDVKGQNGTLLDDTNTYTIPSSQYVSIGYDYDGNGTYDLFVDSTSVTNSDGSTTTTTLDVNPDGATVHSKQVVIVSADGLTTTTRNFIDNGSLPDDIAKDVTVVNSTNRVETIANYSANNTFLNKTNITKGNDGVTRDTFIDSTGLLNAQGNPVWNEDDNVVQTSPGDTTETLTDWNMDGSLRKKVITATTAANYNLPQTVVVQSALDGTGTINLITTTTTTNGGAAGSTVTTTDKSNNNTTLDTTITTASANDLTIIIKTDENGDGLWDTISNTLTAPASNGTQTVTHSDFYTGETSANNGILTEVVNGKALNVILDRTTTTNSGNRQNISVYQDTNGAIDATGAYINNVIVSTTVANNGQTAVWTYNENPDRKLNHQTGVYTSADGLTKYTYNFIESDGVVDQETQNSDITTLGNDGSRTEWSDNYYLYYVNSVATWGLIDETYTWKSGNDLLKNTQYIVSGTGGDTTGINYAAGYNSDGTKYNTVTKYVWSSPNWVALNQIVTTVSANGLTSVTDDDIFGNQTAYTQKTDTIVLGSDGSKTETIFNSYGSPSAGWTTLNKTVNWTSANGLSSTSAVTAKGLAVSFESKGTANNGQVYDIKQQRAPNGTFTTETNAITTATGLAQYIFNYMQDSVNTQGTAIVYSERASSTALNADGSKTTTVTNFRGTSVHDAYQQTVSDGGLLTVTNYDLNGDGNYSDLKTDDQISLGSSFAISLNPTAVAVKQEILTDKVANGAVRDQSITTTDSVGDQSITRNLGVNGGGLLDQTETIVLTTATSGSVPAGSRVDTINDLESDGKTAYETKTTTTTADGLSKITQFTFADYVSWFNGNEFYVHYRPQFDNYTLSDVVTLPQSGATAGDRVDTFTETFYGGSVGETVVTVTSANGLTTTINASGSVDDDTTVATSTTEQTVLNYDNAGGTSVTTSDVNQNVGQSGTLNLTTKDNAIVMTSASGLSTITELDVNGDGTWDVTDSVVYGGSGVNAGNGVKTETLTVLNPITHAQRERDVTVTSSDGRTKTLYRESNGNTAFDDHIEQFVTNADGSTTDTITDYAAANVKSDIITQTTSADGLVSSISIDSNADGTADYGQTSSTLLNANGSEVVTATETAGPSGLVWSKIVTNISANGWNKTSSIYLGGDVSPDESEDDSIVLNSDGSTIETDIVRYTSTGAIKSEIVTNVSANGRDTSQTYYVNGNTTANEVEQKLGYVTADGMLTQINNYYHNGTFANSTTENSIPDQNYQVTTFWNGDQTTTEYIPNRNGSYSWQYFAANGDKIEAAIHTIDTNNVDTWDFATYNTSGNVASETIVTIDVSTENKFEATAARLYDTIFDRGES